MKIILLTDSSNANSPSTRRALEAKRALSGIHDVELLSIPDDLVRASNGGEAPTRSHRMDEQQLRILSTTASVSIPPELGLNRLSEIELQFALSGLTADAVLISDARMASFVVAGLPPEVATIVLHSAGAGGTDRARLAFADAVATPDESLGEWLRDTLGERAPTVGMIPLSAPPHDQSTALDNTIIAFGSDSSASALGDLIRCFTKIVEGYPDWHLRVCLDGSVPKALNRIIDMSGKHGAVSFTDRASFDSLRATASAAVICASADDDSAGIALDCFSAGIPVIVNEQCHASSLVVRNGIDGIVVGPDDEELVAALNLIISDQDFRAKLAARSLDRCRDFEAAATTESWQQLLDRVVAVTGGADRLSELTDRSLAATALESSFPGSGAIRSTNNRQAEDSLLLRCPELFRWGGRLAELCVSTLEPEIIGDNLAHVADALEQADIDYVVLSKSAEPGRIAVAAEHRPAAIEALRSQQADRPVYAQVHRSHHPSSATALASQLSGGDGILGILVFHSMMSASRTLRYGESQGCLLEFWDDDPEDEGFVAPLKPSSRGEHLTTMTPQTEVVIGQRSFPTSWELTVNELDAVDFPIDAVWTWVDDTDDIWRSQRDSYLPKSLSTLGDPEVAARYTNHDELKYSLRSAAMYAPWIRQIYLVTDGQVPPWLDTLNPRITVVNHHEIFSDPSLLPTFNSHAIESQLHHIPGLSETFLYFNDDVFFGRRVGPDKFFTSDMTAKVFPSGTFIPPGPSTTAERPFFTPRKNDRRLIEEEFGKTMIHSYLHTPHSLRVSLLNRLEEKFAEPWATTARERFRSVDDHAIATSLHHGYGLLSGQVMHASIRSRYVKSGCLEHQPLMRQILAQRHLDVFCLNDTGDRDMDPVQHDLGLKAFMESYFPVPAPWERPVP